MGVLIVVLLLLLLGGGVVLFYFMSKSGDITSSEGPVMNAVSPESPTSNSWSHLDSVHHTDDYIPQETIYSYYNPNPGVNCINCDAENPSGMSYCQVCGAKLSSIKY